MATIEINGLQCNFPRVPRGTLQSWCVTSRTHYLAYKMSENPLHNSTISAMLCSAYDFGAMEKPPFWAVDEEGTAVVLLENPSARVMDAVTNWLSWTIGTNKLYNHPYRDALTAQMQRVEAENKDISRTAELAHYDRLYRQTLTAGTPLNIPPHGHTTD